MGRRLVLGTIAMVVGTALVAVGLAGAPGTDAIWIGAGAVIWVITTAVLAPVLGHPVLVACRAVFGRLFGTPGRLAGENALRNPRRTGATASALMIGLAVVSAVGVLAIAGIPIFSGFFSKDAILAAAYEANPLLYVIGLGVALLTAFYMGRWYFLVWRGTYRGHAHPHEADPLITAPLGVLAALVERVDPAAVPLRKKLVRQSCIRARLELPASST